MKYYTHTRWLTEHGEIQDIFTIDQQIQELFNTNDHILVIKYRPDTS